MLELVSEKCHQKSNQRITKTNRFRQRVVSAMNDSHVNQWENLGLRHVPIAPHVVRQLELVVQQSFRHDVKVRRFGEDGDESLHQGHVH